MDLCCAPVIAPVGGDCSKRGVALMAEGLRKRHSRKCASRAAGRCNCEPSVEAWVWSPRDGKKIYRTFSGKGAVAAAKGWRQDAGKQVRGKELRAPTRQTVREAVDEFLSGAA